MARWKNAEMAVRLDEGEPQNLKGGEILVSHNGEEHQFRFVDDDRVVEFYKSDVVSDKQGRIEFAVERYTRTAVEYPLERHHEGVPVFKQIHRLPRELFLQLLPDGSLAEMDVNKRATRIARYVEESTDFVDLWAYKHDDWYALLRSSSPEPKWENVE